MLGESIRPSRQSQNEESTSGQQQMRAAHDSGHQHDQQSIPLNGIQTFGLGFFSSGRSWNMNSARIILAEMLGTFILIFCICGILGSMRLLGSQVGLLEYATTAGSAIIVIVFTLGRVSGAHVNPAVTLAFAVFGHFPWSKVPFYVSAQLLGSILATYLGELVYGVKPELMTTQPIKGGASSAFWAEFIASFIVIFLAASLARDAKSASQISGFVMGIAITLAVLITGPISGGSLNPARSLGPAILSKKFDHIWIYILAPVAGAVLGVLTVHVLCRQQLTPSPNNSAPTPNSLP